MFSLKDNDELLENFNKIWNKANDSIKEDLIANQYPIKNLLKVKLTQVFMIMSN